LERSICFGSDDKDTLTQTGQKKELSEKERMRPFQGKEHGWFTALQVFWYG
jgi:hypothetical protein